VYFPSGLAANGNVFNEWTGWLEDKALRVGPTNANAYNHPTGVVLSYSDEWTLEEWHHFAFVQDSATSEQRLYVDGQMVGQQSASNDIGDGPGQGFIGAIPRDGTVVTSVTGLLDSVRVSSVSRYTGLSFEVPPTDLPADGDTLFVYHFSAEDFFVEDGLTRVTDLSGNARHGTLAAGFDTATSPAGPGTQGDADCNGSISATDALQVLLESVGIAGAPNGACPDLGETLMTGLFGDIDCSGEIVATDAAKLLAIAVGLTATQTEPCPAFRDPV
jgi:hypothetical protein